MFQVGGRKKVTQVRCLAIGHMRNTETRITGTGRAKTMTNYDCKRFQAKRNSNLPVSFLYRSAFHTSGTLTKEILADTNLMSFLFISDTLVPYRYLASHLYPFISLQYNSTIQLSIFQYSTVPTSHSVLKKPTFIGLHPAFPTLQRRCLPRRSSRLSISLVLWPCRGQFVGPYSWAIFSGQHSPARSLGPIFLWPAFLGQSEVGSDPRPKFSRRLLKPTFSGKLFPHPRSESTTLHAQIAPNKTPPAWRDWYSRIFCLVGHTGDEQISGEAEVRRVGGSASPSGGGLRCFGGATKKV